MKLSPMAFVVKGEHFVGEVQINGLSIAGDWEVKHNLNRKKLILIKKKVS
jgi:hypothetical protein